jgi:hypothetical protein
MIASKQDNRPLVTYMHGLKMYLLAVEFIDDAELRKSIEDNLFQSYRMKRLKFQWKNRPFLHRLAQRTTHP